MFPFARDLTDQIYVMKIFGIKNTVRGALLEFLGTSSVAMNFHPNSVQKNNAHLKLLSGRIYETIRSKFF